MKNLRFKKVLAAILFFSLQLLFSPNVHAVSAGILASSALVVDKDSGKVLFARNPRQIKPPASTAKVLTALVVLDELSLNQIIRIHTAATRTQPSVIHLQAGETFYARDLLKAILISSANDAAKALAIGVAGSEANFTEKMNEKAKSLGATHSHFMNASGLPQENQYSTAEDLLRFIQAAEKVPFIMEAMRIKQTTISSIQGRRIYLKNHNKMLWRDSRPIIGKTGWTRNAKHCFVGRMGSGNRVVYIALLGSKNKWKDLSHFADLYISGKRAGKVYSSKKASGYDVMKIQKALRKAGFFKREPTGFFGPVTRRAVTKFQKAHQLPADGIVGQKTWEALSRYL